MGIKIIKLGTESGMGVKLAEDLFLDKEKKKVVLSDDKDAAFLLGRKGQSLDADLAKQYGIKPATEKEAADADARTAKATEAAAKKKKADKAKHAEEQAGIQKKVEKKKKELKAASDKEHEGSKNK